MLEDDLFPHGVMSLVTDDDLLAERLAVALEAASLLHSAHAGILVVSIDLARRAGAAALLEATLSVREQEQVFLLSEAPNPWRLRSLRTVLARNREAWFSELLEEGFLDAALQPIVDLTTRTPFAFEAL